MAQWSFGGLVFQISSQPRIRAVTMYLVNTAEKTYLKENIEMKNIASRFLIVILSVVVYSSCNSDKLQKVSEDQFIGIWELHGRTMFEGIKIEIKKTPEKGLTGRVVKLNENKYVEMFMELNDVWISEIQRSSNYEFLLTEKKIAKELFSLYGISSSNDFKVEFIDTNKFGLAKNNSDPTKSEVFYKKVE
ncbi:hypothetical protein [Labilibacter marinus]|uniref:hypothetical protein n=1 Tax=Labilibacter marinus TaxID=1477105 RepID=UPI00082F9688|nr:hypothetical protein [Labilibacter marinus]